MCHFPATKYTLWVAGGSQVANSQLFPPQTKKAPARFELAISCLLDRRFNQLSHGAGVRDEPIFSVDIPLATHSALGMGQATT